MKISKGMNWCSRFIVIVNWSYLNANYLRVDWISLWVGDSLVSLHWIDFDSIICDANKNYEDKVQHS